MCRCYFIILVRWDSFVECHWDLNAPIYAPFWWFLVSKTIWSVKIWDLFFSIYLYAIAIFWWFLVSKTSKLSDMWNFGISFVGIYLYAIVCILLSWGHFCSINLTILKVNGGREGRPIGAYELAKAVEELGAGEILLNCIDSDGEAWCDSWFLDFFLSLSFSLFVMNLYMLGL